MSNDVAYSSRDFIPDADSYAPRWAAEAEALRARLGSRAELDLSYGEGARHGFDLFRPEGASRGTLVFVHGGFWRLFDRKSFSGFAAGALGAGLNVAMPSYTLAPEARISRITREIAQALSAIGGATEGPILLAGHSAGGHLVARMLCADAMLPTEVAGRIAACVPISPVADLQPLIDTAMNAELRLTEAEAVSESPALQTRALDVPVTVWVGGDERPAFLDQAHWLGAAWGMPVVVEEGRHHFDVIEALKEADSPLMQAILAPL